MTSKCKGTSSIERKLIKREEERGRERKGQKEVTKRQTKLETGEESN